MTLGRRRQGAPNSSGRVGGAAPDRDGHRQRLVGPYGRFFLGSILLTVGLVLPYLLVTVWPAVVKTTGPNAAAGKETNIELFGFISLKADTDKALLLAVILASAVGSYVHVATSFTDYVGNRRLTWSWAWWYILRISIGVALAVVFYFAVRAGFLATDAPSKDINPYGIAAVAGLVGLFSKQASDKLQEVFKTLFRTARGEGDEKRADSIDNPKPLIAGVEPPQLVAGQMVDLVLEGKGFVEDSVVRVTRSTAEGAVALPRDTTYLNPTQLSIRLEADDVKEPGTLQMAVFNPEPGGGIAGPMPLEVRPAETDPSS